MTAAVEVRTGARLHFGLFGTRSEQGRLGGIGMMIDRPGFAIQVRRSDQDIVDAPPDLRPRVRKSLEQIRSIESSRHPARPLAVHVLVNETIPQHHGFGSGTQLSLAVAAAFACLHRTPSVDYDQLGRGTRSLVGTFGFYQGGFILDLGEAAPRFEPQTFGKTTRNTWRLILVDPATCDTVSGPTECDAFAALPPMPPGIADRLASLATDMIVPALETSDFQAFASAVSEFNRLVGEHFAPVQGGVYAHPLIRELARTLADTDWPYLAQSSWGPAAAVFCESEASAEALQRFLGERIAPGEAHLFIAAPLNRGAEVTTIELP